MRIATRTQSIAPFFAMELSKQADALLAQGKDIIKLNIGEPDFGAAPAVQAAMVAALHANKTQYTAALGILPLREAIAQHYWDLYGVRVSANRIVITAGASAALLLTCAALVDVGDEVLMADPCYPCNRHFVGVHGGTTKLIATDASSRYQLSAAAVNAHWGERTQGVLLASPANPTGTSLTHNELAAVCAAVKAKGGFRIVDEIYLGLSYPDEAETASRSSVLSVDNDAVVVQSFSKYFSMTGWRLGWIVAPEPLVPVLETLAQHLFICPSTPTQYAALACFEPDSLALYEQRRIELKARRDYLVPALRALGFNVPIVPDGAFYVYADISRFSDDSTQFAHDLLHHAHVAVTPGKDFGDAAPQRHVRFSYASSMAQLHAAVDRMGRYLNRS